MAITFRDQGLSQDGLAQLTNLLKIWYKDGVTNLLYRNSPLLKMITKERVEGSEQDFNALYGRGGAVAGNFKMATQGAAETIRDAVFKITPGQLFSCYTITAKEILAAKTQRGAFMPIAGAKMFTATEAFRKTIAGALYGMGHGELAYCTIQETAIDKPTGIGSIAFKSATDEGVETGTIAPTALAGRSDKVVAYIMLPLDAVMKIDVNSRIIFKSKITAPDKVTESDYWIVDKIGSTKQVDGSAGYGNIVRLRAINPANFVFPTGATSVEMVVALRGCCHNDEPLLPVGLSAWLPYVSKRDGEDWTNYINTSFMGVVRGVSVDRLAGQFVLEDNKLPSVAGASKTPIADTILALMDMCRTAGSTADMIVMNNKDYQALSKELTPYQTGVYFSDIKNKGKNTPTVGMSDVQFGIATSWLEKVIDDPYCPRGVIYILDKELTKLWTYTNVDNKLQNDGIPDNNPGKPDVMSDQSDATAQKPYQLLVDDLMTIDGGDDTMDGAAARITINFFGSFVLLDPAVCGCAILCDKGNVDSTNNVYNYFDPIGIKLYS